MAAGLKRSTQAGSTSAVIPVQLRGAQGSEKADLGPAGWVQEQHQKELIGDLSTGPLCVPRWLWATSLAVSGQWAGGDGFEARVPGLPNQGRRLAPGWTAQVWCHKDPAAGQMLPGQAVRPQGSGFSDQPLAPGRGEHLGPGSSHCHQSRDCVLGAGVSCEGCRGPACPVLRWHLRSRGSLWEGVLCTPPPW